MRTHSRITEINNFSAVKVNNSIEGYELIWKFKVKKIRISPNTVSIQRFNEGKVSNNIINLFNKDFFINQFLWRRHLW